MRRARRAWLRGKPSASIISSKVPGIGLYASKSNGRIRFYIRVGYDLGGPFVVFTTICHDGNVAFTWPPSAGARVEPQHTCDVLNANFPKPKSPVNLPLPT